MHDLCRNSLLRLRSRVAWSMSLSVVSDVLCKINGWTDRGAVGGGVTREPKETCIRQGSRSPREGAILGAVQPTQKHWGSAAVYAAKGIILSWITTWHAMRPFVKILWLLVELGTINYYCYLLLCWSTIFPVYVTHAASGIVVGFIVCLRSPWKCLNSVLKIQVHWE